MLSIDPSSPFTQGAVLGDRIRLSDHFLDPGVFIRSMATRGSLGGLAEAALQAALLMDASGKDDVLLETVGVGQGEIDIVDHADTIVLALMPGSGDSIQALKAGVMEIPDVIVVNKADHPLADTMVREVRGVLALGPPGLVEVPVVRTEASKGEGIAELRASGSTRTARTSSERARWPSGGRGTCAPRCSASPPRGMRRGSSDRPPSDPDVGGLLDRVVRREIDPATAARELLDRSRPRLRCAGGREGRRPTSSTGACPGRQGRRRSSRTATIDASATAVGLPRLHASTVDSVERSRRECARRSCSGEAGRAPAFATRSASGRAIGSPLSETGSSDRARTVRPRRPELRCVGDDRRRPSCGSRRCARPPPPGGLSIRHARRGSAAELAGDHHLLDLVGALADREDLGVAVEAADRVLLDVAVAAVDLDRLLGRPDREPAGDQLRLGGGEGERLAARPSRARPGR